MKVHFIGIAGTAMAGVALMLRKSGAEVQGSDTAFYPPMGPLLQQNGIQTLPGFRPENISTDLALVVVGNVCRRDNPEVVEAQRLAVPLVSMPELIEKQFLKSRIPLVVTGTHGKTTTTALLTWMLTEAGLDPSFLVGGIALNSQSNHGLGAGRHFVIEGDEYDTAFFDKKAKFFHYRPIHTLITSLEFDHADIYPDLASIEATFQEYVALVPPTGSITTCNQWPVLDRIVASSQATHLRYGLDGQADLLARNLMADEGGTHFELTVDAGTTWHPATLAMWGRHNVLNALGATSLALRAGASLGDIIRSMATFLGVKRRLQLLAQAGGVSVVDDFAHHPTAVRETISACRSRFPGRRLLAIYHFESNTSRRRVFQAEYGEAFRGCDEVYLTHPLVKSDALSADHYLDPEAVVNTVQTYAGFCSAWKEFPAMAQVLANRARPGDVILGMSGRDLSPLYEVLLPSLK